MIYKLRSNPNRCSVI